MIGVQRWTYDLGCYVGLMAGKKVRKELGKVKAKAEDKFFGKLEEVEIDPDEVEIDF